MAAGGSECHVLIDYGSLDLLGSNSSCEQRSEKSNRAKPAARWRGEAAFRELSLRHIAEALTQLRKGEDPVEEQDSNCCPFGAFHAAEISMSYPKYVPVSSQGGLRGQEVSPSQERPECWFYLLHSNPQKYSTCRLLKTPTPPNSGKMPVTLSKRSNRSLTKVHRVGESECKQTTNNNKNNNSILHFGEHPRFGYATNSEYCKVVGSLQSYFAVRLYVKNNASENKEIKKLQIDLASACLSAFFFPAGSVAIHCVDDMQSKISKLFNRYDARFLHSGKYSIDEMQLVLLLSSDAATLIRHPELCFLHTLAAVLGTSQHNLFVLTGDKYCI